VKRMDEGHFAKERQTMFWCIPCTVHRLKNRADIVGTHVVNLNGYEAIDIRVRRNTAHRLGPGFSKEGIRLRMDEAVSLWKALGQVLSFEEE